jgi:ABC-2 type transport system ATP-binding protein
MDAGETTTGDGLIALEARGVAKRYGRRVLALDGLDLAIRAGTITALVGPNGAGKSTLIKAWVGFERPSRGWVSVLGVDPFRQRTAALARIGYVPQTASLYRELTVRDHLDLVATMRHRFDLDHAAHRLEQLGISLAQKAGELSGGQQSQVNLALALGTRAEILLLDEPLASLDPLARREFLYVLTDAVRSTGRTALLSSHIVTDIEQACDHRVVLGMGRKLLDRPIADAIAEHAIDEHPADPGDGGRLAASTDGVDAVGSFFDPRGGRVTLVRTQPGATPDGSRRAATLEEVVLGYLASARPRPSTIGLRA